MNTVSLFRKNKIIKNIDQTFICKNLTTDIKLPSELLILNRYGIGYPYLKAAWKLSQKHAIPAFEILIKAKVISFETWINSQELLYEERKKIELKHKQEKLLLDQSIHNLNKTLPIYSAKRTFNNWQIIFFAMLFIFIPTFFYYHYDNAILSFLICFTFFYLGVILLRGLLLAHFKSPQPISTSIVISNDANLPIYSVLVALYKESDQIEQLAKHLLQLDWPREKLDIKLICEGDDYKTIAKIEEAKLPPCFELLRVPPAHPRTKPKALNYALPLCRGKYLVLYDAEDMPSKGQLREAYMKFQSESSELACLQAPLNIHNHSQSWLATMFAIEYATLFNGILPTLARWRVPIPLGGTSNHFKVDILKRIGAWDPYNVTEDADLGIRLFREGYRCSTITLPTFEEAPPHLVPWIKQRTRWLKGWMQTILVHSRNPIHFLTDIGFKNAITFHLLMTSIVISMLVYPIFLAASFWQLYNLGTTLPSKLNIILVATSVFNLVGGFTTYGLLAYATLQKSNYKPFSGLLLTLPIYWLLISFAGWRALLHLIVKPHHWEKTPHGLVK